MARRKLESLTLIYTSSDVAISRVQDDAVTSYL
jgi:hypothetical protein